MKIYQPATGLTSNFVFEKKPFSALRKLNKKLPKKYYWVFKNYEVLVISPYVSVQGVVDGEYIWVDDYHKYLRGNDD